MAMNDIQYNSNDDLYGAPVTSKRVDNSKRFRTIGIVTSTVLAITAIVYFATHKNAKVPSDEQTMQALQESSSPFVSTPEDRVKILEEINAGSPARTEPTDQERIDMFTRIQQ
jgi:cell division protein FtsN